MISRWDTVLSDCKKLYFSSLNDTGEGRVVFEDENGEKYELLLDGWCGPYAVVDEEFLSKYWVEKQNVVGWTFTVEAGKSGLIKAYMSELDSNQYEHFVISTYDSCIELLSRKIPVIRKV